MKRPNRKRKKDNPYFLEKNESEGKYNIIFFDSKGILKRVCIQKNIFDAMDKFELDDVKELNEFDRHIEHLNIIENEFVLYKRTLNKEKLISEMVEQSIDCEKLWIAIGRLSDIQRRRIIKYYFKGENEYKIAKEEGVSQQSVHIGLKKSLSKLKEILKSLNF